MFGAYSYTKSNRLILASRPVLRDLAEETGFTASVYVRFDYSRVVVARVEGREPQRYQLPIGERLPLQFGGGRVLVAAMSPTQIDDMFTAQPDVRYASGKPIDRADFDQDLDRIRSNGYRHAIDERIIGVSSISAPVARARGTDPAAIQITSTTTAFVGRVPELKPRRPTRRRLPPAAGFTPHPIVRAFEDGVPEHDRCHEGDERPDPHARPRAAMMAARRPASSDSTARAAAMLVTGFGGWHDDDSVVVGDGEITWGADDSTDCDGNIDPAALSPETETDQRSASVRFPRPTNGVGSTTNASSGRTIVVAACNSAKPSMIT